MQPIFSGVGAVLFGIAILCALRILAGRDESTTGNVVGLGLTIAAWTLIAMGLFGGILLLSGVLIGPIGLIVLVMMLMRYYKAQQRALLCTLAAAVQRLMPLGPALRAFAAENHWLLSSRARRMADLLEAGLPLPLALDRCPRLLSPEAAMSVRLGYDAGSLARSLREAEESQAIDQGLWGQIAGRLMYLGAVAMFALGIWAFVMLKIVPQFYKIFQDFDVALPQLTQLLVAGSKWTAAYWWCLAPVFWLFGLLAAYAVLRYVGVVEWELPGTRWLTRRRHTATILRELAVMVQRQQPMTEALGLLAQWYPTGWVRTRLRWAWADVEAGRPWAESLAAEGLIGRADQAILQAAQRVGNLPWAMREMADSNDRRLAYRLHLVLQIGFPVVILGYGLLGAVFVVGLFVPLVALIQRCVGG